MILSFVRAGRCVRCKRSLRGEPLKAAMTIQPVRWWIGFRFRICPDCADQMVEAAAHNPKLKLRRVEG